MRHILDISEALVACWTLAGSGDKIPTSNGIMDHVLKAAIEHDSCPSWLRDELHFADSRIGLQCAELPSVLDWAQRGQLTGPPNLSCRSVRIRISARAASILLHRLHIDEEDAKLWGKHLKTLADDIRSTIDENSMAAVDHC